MYPKLWEASGIPYSQLLDRLIELALERHREKSRTRFTYSPNLAQLNFRVLGNALLLTRIGQTVVFNYLVS